MGGGRSVVRCGCLPLSVWRLAEAKGGEAGGAVLTGLLPTPLPPAADAHVPDDAAGTEQGKGLKGKGRS